MDYDFQTFPESLVIPPSSYQAMKRCQFCKSLFLTDKFCESCGSSVDYNPIGTPFGAKSFYGIKERYIENHTFLIKFFPFFENKKSTSAKRYVRNLEKRFSDL